MAARAMASGMVSIGLVSFPVKIYPACESERSLELHLLHPKCGSKLKQQFVCPADGETVERKDAVRGYEVAKDEYAVLTEEEIEALESDRKGSIDIIELADPSNLDLLLYEKPYFLGTGSGGGRCYELLLRALLSTRLAAICLYASRGVEHLAIIRPGPANRLVLHQIRYLAELRKAEDVPIDFAPVDPDELELMTELVETKRAKKLDLTKFKDEQKEKAEALIAQKVAGQEIKVAPKPGQAQIIDLKTALEKSLAGRRRAPKTEKKKRG